jgi:hypothetical protein
MWNRWWDFSRRVYWRYLSWPILRSGFLKTIFINNMQNNSELVLKRLISGGPVRLTWNQKHCREARRRRVLIHLWTSVIGRQWCAGWKSCLRWTFDHIGHIGTLSVFHTSIQLDTGNTELHYVVTRVTRLGPFYFAVAPKEYWFVTPAIPKLCNQGFLMPRLPCRFERNTQDLQVATIFTSSTIHG